VAEDIRFSREDADEDKVKALEVRPVVERRLERLGPARPGVEGGRGG
jgi:hypothetical protein